MQSRRIASLAGAAAAHHPMKEHSHHNRVDSNIKARLLAGSLNLGQSYLVANTMGAYEIDRVPADLEIGAHSKN